MPDLLPLFLNLTGRDVLLVGGGPVATAKLRQLLAAGARVRVVSPAITDEIGDVVARPVQGAAAYPVLLEMRPFAPADLDGAWLVVAAATPEVNRQVAEVAETRRIFVNAVDDPDNATAFLGGVVRRDGVTLAISTSGAAPALTALLREGLDAMLPRDLASWMWQARAARVMWRRDGLPMEARKPRLLKALNELYSREATAETAPIAENETVLARAAISTVDLSERGARVPWLNGPEDSWL